MRTHGLRRMKLLLTALCGGGVALLTLSACAGTPRAPHDPGAVDAYRGAPEDGDAPLKVATETVPETEAWRASVPEAGEPPDIVTPVFSEAKLENGMRVIVSRRTDLPLVSFNMAFRAGASADPAGLAGLAGLTYALFLEGAGELDAMELSDAFADLGTSPYTTVEKDGALIGVRALSRNAKPALALLAEVIRNPRLHEADFERRKRQQIANLTRSMGQPRWLAGVALSSLIFGENHPYGQPSGGTPWSVELITIDDLRAFHSANVGPASAAFVVTGDVDLETATAWAEEHFGDWEGETTEIEVPAAPSAGEREEVVLIEQPGMQQTLLMLGRPGLAVGDEDEMPLLLAGQIFGGMFGSRLNMNLREDKGYTYRAFARVSTRRGAGQVTAGSSVQSEVTSSALREVFGELEGLRERPITEEEFASAREAMIRAIPGWFETIESLGRSAARLFWHDRPLDRYETLIDELEAVTLEEVQAAAEKYFDPRKLHLVLVGDPAIIEDQVPPLGLGELVRHTLGPRVP